MPHLKYTTSKGASLLSVAAVVLYATAALAQSAKDGCGPTPVIPLTSEEPPAKIVTYPPLAEPLASRGVAIIQYCTQNLHLVPVFGPNALAVSPRVGHIHVRVDDASWVWADASGNPIILMGLPPGPHKVLVGGIMSTATTASPIQREPELLGQTVVVIGGSAGIGLETARRARAEGANLILTGRNPERLQRAASELGAVSTAFDATDFERL